MPDAFSRHVRDAIALNLQRAPGYAAASGGLSRRVSRRLVAMERALLPLAARLDRHRGAALLEEAFVPMNGARPATTPSHWRSGGSMRAWWGATTALARLQVRGLARLALGRAEALEGLCLDGLHALDALESRHRVHLAMSRHLVESTARAARLATRPSDRALASGLVALHLAGLPLAAWVDRSAWPAQAAGAGILVNDLPPVLGSGTNQSHDSKGLRQVIIDTPENGKPFRELRSLHGAFPKSARYSASVAAWF